MVALIEWPERAAGVLPPDRIDIALSHRAALGSTARAAEITGYGKRCASRATQGAARVPRRGGLCRGETAAHAGRTRRSVPMRGSSATMAWSS